MDNEDGKTYLLEVYDKTDYSSVYISAIQFIISDLD